MPQVFPEPSTKAERAQKKNKFRATGSNSKASILLKRVIPKMEYCLQHDFTSAGAEAPIRAARNMLKEFRKSRLFGVGYDFAIIQGTIVEILTPLRDELGRNPNSVRFSSIVTKWIGRTLDRNLGYKRGL